MRQQRESQISNGLTRQKNNFARASRFFVHVFAKRQMLLIFCERFIWSKQTYLSNGLFGLYFHDSTTEL